MYFKTNYVCTTPLNSNSPSIIVGDMQHPYSVSFIDKDKNEIVSTINQTNTNDVYLYSANRQWYTDCKIIVNNDEKIYF